MTDLSRRRIAVAIVTCEIALSVWPTVRLIRRRKVLREMWEASR